MRIHRIFCLPLFLVCVACNSGGSPTPPPTPAPPNPGSTDPCSSVSITGSRPPADAELSVEGKRAFIDGHNKYNVLDALALHRARGGPETLALREAITPAPRNADIGEIAIVQDEGDLIAPPNAFDLRGAGVRFTRSGSGYAATRIDGTFRATLGRQLQLGDDDSAPAPSQFGFPFYGQTQTAAFVNSDGNVTFGEEDRASTERNIARLLTGPPRVAPFLSDLDPSVGGRVFVNATTSEYTVTWCNVRGFDSPRTISTQMTLLPDGVIEFKYGTNLASLVDAVVGVSPGRTGDFTPVDLSQPGPNGGPAAIGERFAERHQLDTVALIRKFYRTHDDSYDQLVIWTDQPLIQDAFAYEATVANEVRGIGLPLFDASRDFGSGGRLRSFAMMDWIGKYPDDPAQKFLGENTTLSVLGQEVGHRWLAFLEFRDHTGARSDQLLGRGESHWSFFFDSDASVMEGNDIQDLGGGSFRTVGAVSRYSLLDQYAMGLVDASEVPTFFYVQNPINVIPSRTRESSPQVGVTFNGTRRDVHINDVIAVHGPRVPSAAEAPKVHRQAFVYVVSAGRTPNTAHVTKIDQIRRAWETFFRNATDGRMQAITTLR
ncbi:MAG TPA: hypothetical protein VM364_03075 [Vicinamibacterales bacterium]|nr:hypothetical protein [Vicinamibacterales bacterium]